MAVRWNKGFRFLKTDSACSVAPSKIKAPSAARRDRA